MDMDDEVQATPVLAQRLDAHGRGLAARYTPAFPWAGPLAIAMRRAVTLAQPHDGHFHRVEISPDAPPQRRSQPGRVPASPGASAVTPDGPTRTAPSPDRARPQMALPSGAQPSG